LKEIERESKYQKRIEKEQREINKCHTSFVELTDFVN
jgi:hypothetical protein